MKLLKLLSLSCLFPLMLLSQQVKKTDPYENYPSYRGKDLGVTYTPKKTVFKVWAPKASEVVLRLYTAGNGAKLMNTINLNKEQNGVWVSVVKRDIRNIYYTFQVKQDDKWLLEKPDIYAKAVGVNGARGMVADMASTSPANWKNDKRPPLKNLTDITLYESHVRDFSISKNSGIKHQGKFLGMVEKGTKSPAGESTGLDHLKELGITHIHLLPSFDFNSVDETNPDANYNWGYDPINYNVPEGSYSSNPYDGNSRIKEFKQMIQTLHANGIRVILDVVYNHTANKESGFNQFAPGYFYRHNPDGTYSNGTGCGNETASERPMMRKFMIESVAYWAREYHMDGFRFDLMGVHDIETMNLISDTLRKIDPTIFVYGEGWTAGNSPYPEDLRAVKKNTFELNKIAAFSDDIRDGLRGPYNDVKVKGFASGAKGMKENVKFGIVAATQHPQVNYQAVSYSKKPWASEPYQSINYVSCHDDNTLYDRLKAANPDASEADLIKMDKLSQAVVLTSQGVPLLHSGAEMLRTKMGVANSYNMPDSINEIDWSRKTKYNDVFTYYKSLIALRKHHPAFRMPSAEMIRQYLKFIDIDDPLLIEYQITGHANGDKWKDILVFFNGDQQPKTVNIPSGQWILAADGSSINEKGIKQNIQGEITIPGTSAYILYRL